MQYTLKNEQIEVYNESKKKFFPKYTSQLINWANQNAQGTRPATVGQMSELFLQFMKSDSEKTVDGWAEWYKEHYPEAFDKATDKIYAQVRNLQAAITLIDRDMVKEWVKDLIISKTFNGLYIQKAVLASLAEKKNLPYRLACPDEESKGIDGFVGSVAYSVKPETYKTMKRLSEDISVKMIYYCKTKTGFKIEVED